MCSQPRLATVTETRLSLAPTETPERDYSTATETGRCADTSRHVVHHARKRAELRPKEPSILGDREADHSNSCVQGSFLFGRTKLGAFLLKDDEEKCKNLEN